MTLWKKEGQATEDELAFRKKIINSEQFAKSTIVLCHELRKGWIDHHVLVKEKVCKDPARAYLILQRFENEGLLTKVLSRAKWKISKDITIYKKTAEDSLKSFGYEIKEED